MKVKSLATPCAIGDNQSWNQPCLYPLHASRFLARSNRVSNVSLRFQESPLLEGSSLRYTIPTFACLMRVSWAGLILFSVSHAWAEDTPAASPEVATPEKNAAGIELFEKHIRPVLIEKCYSCHSQSADSIEGDLELDTSAGLAAGGISGPILDKEKVESSLLLKVLRHEEGVESMPPDEKLDDETILAFKKWISIGAPDPRDSSLPTSQQMRAEEQLKHWAFQPPQASTPPTVAQADWPQGMIDSFILAQLEAKNLQPTADASRETLVRRLYFDLIGLPPTVKDVRQYVEDQSVDAVDRLVDRLLASPRYGERWARHWFDVVRYAESSGKEFNFTYPHAWPYRDYVIEALNSDKPYNEFVREQIAGDLMPEAPYELPANRESRLIATSFLSFGPKRHSSGGTAFRMEIVDDQIDVTCRAILGITVSCAKCHDHKFDPIPTKDYYSLAGIFLSTDPLYGTILQKYSNNPTDLLPIGPNAQAKHDALIEYNKMVEAVEKPLTTKKAELTTVNEAKKTADKNKGAAEKQIAANQEAGIEEDSALKKKLDEAVAAAKIEADNITRLNAEILPLQAAVDELKKKRPPAPAYAMMVRDSAKPADVKVAIRGNLGSRGDLAPRGFLTALQVDDVPEINPKQSGRLELANWMTSKKNPLPARVIVNRIWHHLFGRGLVSSVDNFGLMGSKPTHPELLDTLAVKFMEEGWSVKRLIRAITTSHTYQLSCNSIDQNMQIDPDNKLLWRSSTRRLPAEVIRDAMLAVSGQLQIIPPEGSTVTGLGDKMVRNIDTKKLQPPSNHRSVYLAVVRDYAPEMFDRFDFPSSALVSGSRAVTNTPSQGLFLRNSEFVVEQSSYAARRLLAEKSATDDVSRVDLAVRWVTGRKALTVEYEEALKLIDPIRKSQAEIKDRDVAAWATLFQALFSTAEFRYLVDIDTH